MEHSTFRLRRQQLLLPPRRNKNKRPLRPPPVTRTRQTKKRQWRTIHLRLQATAGSRSEEHTSELQPLMRLTYAVYRFNTKTINHHTSITPLTQLIHT